MTNDDNSRAPLVLRRRLHRMQGIRFPSARRCASPGQKSPRPSQRRWARPKCHRSECRTQLGRTLLGRSSFLSVGSAASGFCCCFPVDRLGSSAGFPGRPSPFCCFWVLASAGFSARPSGFCSRPNQGGESAGGRARGGGRARQGTQLFSECWLLLRAASR